MPLVSKPISFACRAERLARTTTGPDRSVIAPAGASQGVAPHTDTGEEMTLGITGEVGWPNVAYVSLIHIPWCNYVLFYQFAQPRCGEGVKLVVIRTAHSITPPSSG